jgi:hypothetical protein
MLKNKSKLFLLYISLSAVLFTAVPVNNVFASLQITEIMYSFPGSDTLSGKSREWIEIYNPDSIPVDITKIKLREADTNHTISISSGASTLGPLSYAVIADTPVNFSIDNPNYSGILFDSIFSLSNTGEPLELRNSSGTIFDSVTYNSSMGANGDGNSLQKINNIWTASIPTPGVENIFLDSSTSTATTSDNQDSSNNTSTSTSSSTSNTSGQAVPVTKIITRTLYISAHSGTEDLNNYDEKNSFQVTAGRERMALVGSILEFDAKYTLSQKDQCMPFFTWSFGDGLEAAGKKVEHTYKFPGEYNVILNANCADSNSVSRTKVKMISPDISIATTINGDIEIINNSRSEINIGDWVIKGGQKDFVLARDTMISANNKIILSNEDLNNSSKIERVSLHSPSGREVTHFTVNEQHNVLSSKPDTISATGSSISVAEAERLADQYKKTLAMNGQEVSTSKKVSEVGTINDGNDVLANGSDTNQTASVLEAVNQASVISFWNKLIDFPINSMKSLVRIFYNF